jgi:tripartite-type tricarboxylate transporter receptor subunit TctC
MKFNRRKLLHLAAGAAGLRAFTRIAWAQAYPTRPVRIVVGYPPGGPTDIVARIIGPWLSERLGQSVIVENRPGATGNIGTETVARAAPDGTTLLLATVADTINATLYEKLNFNFIRDIAPVASILRSPNVMVVNPSFPAMNVPEFIAYAKANPGKINMASSGSGSSIHVSGELFKMMADINMLHVPYRGSAPALFDLLGGQVQVMFDSMPSSLQHIKSSRLRALAVTTTNRSEVLPDVPSVSEFLPEYNASGWVGIGAPKDTPVLIIRKLNNEINAGLNDSRVRARLTELGGTIVAGSPDDFGKMIVEETKKWATVVKFSGAKPD